MERRDFLKGSLLLPLALPSLNVFADSLKIEIPEGKIIILDPGHGNINSKGIYDPGAISYDGRHQEADLVLDLAKYTSKIFERVNLEGYLGCDVVRTRKSNNVELSLKDRVDLANKSGADVFVSLHYNSSPSQEPRGVNTYYCKGSKEGKILAEFVQEEILRYLKGKVEGFENTHGAVREGNFYVLKHTKMPAVLVEPGFLSNQKDLEYILKDSHFIAGGIANGIGKYFYDLEARKKDK
ncbi:MAG: N-acetylmuramoyl-L-alanine amidase [Candidatus Pacearchaeota archaeon]